MPKRNSPKQSGMDNHFENLQRMTDSFVQRLDTLIEEDFNRFLKERERLIELIVKEAEKLPDVSPYREKVQRILEADPLILDKMQQLKMEAASTFSRVNIAGKQRDKYLRPYAADSYFFDKKK